MDYVDTCLQELNNGFSVLYHYVFKMFWHNSEYALMNANMVYTDWKRGMYAVFMPTFPDTYGMKYYLVMVVVSPTRVSQEDVDRFMAEMKSWAGRRGLRIDSETLCVMAPATVDNRHVQGKGETSRGRAELVIIERFPRRAVKRLTSFVVNFIWKRLKAMFERVHLDQLWNMLYNDGRFRDDCVNDSIWTSIKEILNRRKLQIVSNAIACLAKTFNRLAGFMVELLKRFTDDAESKLESMKSSRFESPEELKGMGWRLIKIGKSYMEAGRRLLEDAKASMLLNMQYTIA